MEALPSARGLPGGPIAGPTAETPPGFVFCDGDPFAPGVNPASVTSGAPLPNSRFLFEGVSPSTAAAAPAPAPSPAADEDASQEPFCSIARAVPSPSPPAAAGAVGEGCFFSKPPFVVVAPSFFASSGAPVANEDTDVVNDELASLPSPLADGRHNGPGEGPTGSRSQPREAGGGGDGPLTGPLTEDEARLGEGPTAVDVRFGGPLIGLGFLVDLGWGAGEGPEGPLGGPIGPMDGPFAAVRVVVSSRSFGN